MADSVSPLNDLQAAIQQDNPFNRELIIKRQAVWNGEFIDVPSINAEASDTVFRALADISQGRRNVAGVSLVAEKGLGKSHIIGRIRHHLRSSGGAWFIYMGDYNNLNHIKPEFLNILCQSLRQTGSQEVMQWQELAADLLNEALKQSRSAKDWMQEIKARIKTEPDLIDELVNEVSICQLDNGIDNSDPYLIRSILWTLDRIKALQAIRWISGKGISSRDSDMMGLPEQEEDDQIDEFERSCQILDLISQYNPILICFDQLEGTEMSDSGFSKAQVIVTLAMDLYNSLKKGVILTALYPDIWQHQITSLPQAEAVVDRIGETRVDLNYLNSENVVNLVQDWLKQFYEQRGLTPPTSIYPFKQEALEAIGRQRATARDILQHCKSHWGIPDAPEAEVKVEETPPPTTTTTLKPIFEKELANLDIEERLEDKSRLAKALKFAYQFLMKIKKNLGDFEIEAVEGINTPASEARYCLDFRIIGQQTNESVKIGVMVLQMSGGRGVQAGLKRLVDYDSYGITRGCLVRSKDISRSAQKAQSFRDQLLQEKGGKWVSLKAEPMKPLLALLEISESLDDYEIDEAQLQEFIEAEGLLIDNPLLQEIVSRPSGQKPEDVVDEDADSGEA